MIEVNHVTIIKFEQRSLQEHVLPVAYLILRQTVKDLLPYRTGTF